MKNSTRIFLLAFLFSILGVASDRGVVVAYTYNGACNGLGTYTWDWTTYSAPNIDGLEMDQYVVPGASSWHTCTYQGSGGYGHMDELLSLQGPGSGQIVQIGIAKYVNSGGTSWIFIFTPDDSTGGAVIGAGPYFGEEPVAGRTYWFHIQAIPDVNSPTHVSWEYCIKDFATNHRACWDQIHNWSVSTFLWIGGETADANSTMGAHPQANTFRTYALREHLSTGSWGGYFGQGYINGHCGKSGLNDVRCTGLTTNGFGGFYIWTP